MENYYADEADFFGLFEADTFDEEVYEDFMFKCYVTVDGERKLAATFAADGTGGGTGWYDTTLV
jgi:hypothetical protein